PSSTLPSRITALIAAAVALVFGALSFVPSWQDLELKGFDVLAVRTAPMRSTLPITIIALDEASVSAMGMQLPWPRATHAKLIEKLNQAGAMLIVFDMIFNTPSNAGPKDDAAFAEAIRK